MVKTNKNQCPAEVIDKKTGKLRRCKNKYYYCRYHQPKEDFIYSNKCCYCNDEIKIESQACGSCARVQSMKAFGFN